MNREAMRLDSASDGASGAADEHDDRDDDDDVMDKPEDELAQPSRSLRAFADCLKETALQLTRSRSGLLLCVSRRTGRILLALETAAADAAAAVGDGPYLGHTGEHFRGLELWEYAEGADVDAVEHWWHALLARSCKDGDAAGLAAPELEVMRRHRTGYSVPMRLFPLCQHRAHGVVCLFEAPRVAEPLLRPPQTTSEDQEEKVLAYVHRLGEVLNLGVWEFDFGTSSIWWSPKLYDLFRRSPSLGPMAQAEFGAAVHPEDAERYALVNEETLTTGKCLIQSLRLRRMDGTWWNAMAHSYVEREADGSPGRMWGIFFDDTARAERESAVQRQREKALVAERVAAEQQLFISYVFHEVRNPLNVVSLGLAAVADAVPMPPGGEMDVIVRSMTQNIQDATDMLNNMIDLTRLEDGIFSVRLEPVNCADVLRRSAKAHQAVALRKRIRLEFACAAADADSLTVRADRYRLAQLFNNLAGNALKFTPEGGTLVLSADLVPQSRLMRDRARAVWFGGPRPGKRALGGGAGSSSSAIHAASNGGDGSSSSSGALSKRTVEAAAQVTASLLPRSSSARAVTGTAGDDDDEAPEPLFVVVSIKDNGCGIAPDDVASLFKPFKQISALEKQNGKGAGLGLAISRRIVELHQGWVVVDSVVGAGSDFCVVLPHFPAKVAPPAPGDDARLERMMFAQRAVSTSSGDSSNESSGADGDGTGGGNPEDGGGAQAEEDGQPSRKVQKRLPGRWQRGSNAAAGSAEAAAGGPATASAASAAAAASSAAAAGAEPNMLGEVDMIVVEDDPIVTRMLSQRLRKSGARSVREFPNGQAFLDCVAAGGTHARTVVLLDDVMPVLSGSETLRELQKPPYKGAFEGRVVVCSGNASVSDMRRFLESGAHGFLAKPITMPKLLAAIDDLFEER